MDGREPLFILQTFSMEKQLVMECSSGRVH